MAAQVRQQLCEEIDDTAKEMVATTGSSDFGGSEKAMMMSWSWIGD